MKITALDIHQKEFTHGMRGYREDEVDDFLDKVAAEYEALTREVAALTKRVQEAEAKALGLDAERNAINSALLIAQRSADDLMAKARGEVNQIIADAEAKGSQIVHESLALKRELLAEIKRLKVEEESFRAGIKRVVSGALQAIEEVLLPSEVAKELESADVASAVVAQAVAVTAPEYQAPAAHVTDPESVVAVVEPIIEPMAAAPTVAPAVAADIVIEDISDPTSPQPAISQSLIMGEVGAAPALNVELEEPAEFQFGGASVWGESDDDIEIEEID